MMGMKKKSMQCRHVDELAERVGQVDVGLARHRCEVLRAQAVFPHMHKEIGSRPEYYVKFEDVAIFWQYDNHDRSYVQISVIDFDCPTFDSYEALLKYNTK